MYQTYTCRCGTNLLVLEGEKRAKCGVCGETNELPAIYWRSFITEQHNDSITSNPFVDYDIVPWAIKGWNWGAFLLGPLWSIGNNVPIGLLCCIPYVGIVMSFFLGAEGNERAWRRRKWKSVEDFKKCQRVWTIAGVIITAAVIAGYAILLSETNLNSQSYQEKRGFEKSLVVSDEDFKH